MQSYWLTFTDGSKACCQGQNPYDAKIIAEKFTGKTVAGDKFRPDAKPLPYPASPVIWQFDHPVNGKTPDFCCQPNRCAGLISCPLRRSCCE